MEKKNWQGFLSSKLKSEISLSVADKIQTWALFLLGLWMLGSGIKSITGMMGSGFLSEVKVLFLILAHLIIVVGFYLPNILEKGGKPVARMLGIRHFSSLVIQGAILTFLLVVVTMLSQQVFAAGSHSKASGFYMLMAGLNLGLMIFYLGTGLFSFLSLAFFPNVLIRLTERVSKAVYVFLGLHIAMIVLLGISYAESVELGSRTFFEQIRVSGMFWIGLLGLLFFAVKFLKESPVAALGEAELEVTSGRLERHEDILARYRECFISRRFWNWIRSLSRAAASRAHGIAGLTHEAVRLVSLKSPSEMDLRKVEDQYKKADSVYRKLEKENQRFLLFAACLDPTEIEKEKIEELKDQFSKELRNAKLELAGVRKRIDEKLLSLRNSETSPAPEVPVEKVPLSR